MRIRISLCLAFAAFAAAQTYNINTFAGGAVPTGAAATNAGFNYPAGVAVDSQENVYVASSSRSQVWVVTSSGIITSVIGTGECGFSGDGGPASTAHLCSPNGVAVDSSGNIYIADTINNRIREVSDGIISTIAGNGTQGYSGDGGAATEAALNLPYGVAVDSAGNVYIADQGDNRIRKISGGLIQTIAGSGMTGYSGDGGPATSAQLWGPEGVAVDANGNVYIADSNNSRIREVSGGVISTIAGIGGGGSFSGDGGPATSAQLWGPQGVAVDANGNVYIADLGNSAIREVSGGVISTIAGIGGTQGYSGDGGAATSAQLYYPYGVAVGSSGNIYIADTRNNRVREVSAGVITTFAGNGSQTNSFGNGGVATGAGLLSPSAVVMDSSGNVYIADTGNCQIRKVSAGIITVVAGTGVCGYSGDGGGAASAQLSGLGGVAVDSAGDIYIADSNNNRIREISGGIISTIAGNGTAGYSGDGGPGTSAELNSPIGLAVDSNGNVYIADVFNYRIRKISGGVISTIAGNGTPGYSGDGGAAISAQLFSPLGVALDSNGNVYIADTNSDAVREISSGIISTIAGNGTAGYSGDGGPATSAELYFPWEVAVDSNGNLYITDQGNNRVRTVSGGIIQTIAGNGTAGYGGDGGSATSAELYYPSGVAVDSNGSVYIADTDNNRIRELTPLKTQAITFGALPNQVFGAPSFIVTANASSGLPVSFASLTASICTVTGKTVTLVSVGQCTMQATQTGNTEYAPAASINQSFEIAQASQTINFGPLSNQVFGTAPFPLAATASSGLSVAFTSTTNSVCTVVGATVTLVAVGTCTIQTTQSGNANYLAATPVSQSFQVTVSSQPTTTSLSASPNPSILGSAAAISATVSPSAAAGTVTFYDGATVLGVAPLVSGVATYHTNLLSTGARSLTARYTGGGSTAYGPSFSSAYQESVNSRIADTFTQASGSPISVGDSPFSIAVADFNGDGVADLAVANSGIDNGGANNITVLLGTENGNFAPASGSPFAVGVNPYSVVAADFNGDGKVDLAVANYRSNSVTVLLGDGMGGFTPASGGSPAVGSFPTSLAVGDFNGDGIADLAVANRNDNDVTILIGDGNGGFAPANGSPFTVGNQPFSVAVGDFNGDGVTDLATANLGDNTVTVLLGSGSGGFTLASGSPFAVGSQPVSVAVGDFNGDGLQDLATANSGVNGGNSVTVLLGSGNGNFDQASGSPFAVGSAPTSVAVGDFNGDGKADLVAANGGFGNNDVTVLLGNGNGGFTAESGSPFPAGRNPQFVAVGDFNSDGRTDIAVANLTSNNVTVLLGADVPTQLQITQQPSAGIAGVGVGNVAAQVEDAAGNLQTGSTAAVTISSSPAGVGGTLTVDAVGGVATFNNLVFGAAGNYTLTASSAGLTSASSVSIAIAAAGQTITFGTLSNQVLGTAAFLVSATASSGLQVAFASTTDSVCTVSGSTVTLVAAGTCTIQTTQSGNAEYSAATPVNQNFQILQPGVITSSLLVGSAAGSSSVLLNYGGGWTATSNSSFLHVSAGNVTGTGSGLVIFSYDAFAGTGTRTGTLTIAGLTLTVTQAGTNYIGPGPMTTLISSGLNLAYGVAVDSAGNVYIADTFNQAIKEWNASTQQVTTLVSSGLDNPVGVAVDGAGNVYIGDSGNNAIKEWNASTQQVTTLVSSGLNTPTIVAVDGFGNVYIADTFNHAIKEWNASTQQVTTLVSSGLNYPWGVAVDGSGNVYIADSGNGAIKELSASTQQLTTLVSSGLVFPQGVIVDGSGNVYIVDTHGSAVKEWHASTQQVSTLVSVGLNFPYGVALDSLNNLYIADQGNNAIKEIPYAFAGPASVSEPAAAGSDVLLPTLPSTTSLAGVFAPTSDQSWLNIGTIANGVVNFAFTGNTSASARVAHINVLGQQIIVTQNGSATQSPSITSPSSTTFTLGSGGSFTVTASGSPVPTLVESGSLPNGVTFNSTTNMLSGTPAAGTNGTYNITFTASNGVGTNATQAFSLTVSLPTVMSVVVSPTSVSGGFSNSRGTVTLNAAAIGTAAQRTVLLSSSDPAAIVPATVTIPGGGTSVNFVITSHTVTATALANISATLNGGTQSASLTVTLGPEAASVVLNPSSVAGGITNSIGTVTLNAPAVGTAAQRTVTLTSDNTAAATVPASVTVPANATSANFTVTSLAVSASATANISATLNGVAQSAVLTVTPRPGVVSIILNPASVIGGSVNSTATVTLSAPAVGTAAQRTAALSSSDTASATVPASVAVAAGSTTATFTVTSHVVAATATPTITATLNGSGAAVFTVSPLAVASVVLNPSSVAGGITNSIGTVTLSAPAVGTPAQRTVTLTSDNTAAATVPASVTVPANATSANFTVTSLVVGASAAANISATLNGVAQSAVLTVTPRPGVVSIILNPTSVLGGSANSTATVTLSAPAVGTAAQRTVNLSSSDTPSATVPASVAVATGSTTATFTVTSHVVAATATPTITATLNGSSAAALTVNPLTVISVTLNPNSVVGGAGNSTAIVAFNGPASGTAAQRKITLSSSNTAAGTVPASVTAATGATSVSFTVTSHAVASTTSAIISASVNGSTPSSTLTVVP